jgi:addiction module HigA family antidote
MTKSRRDPKRKPTHPGEVLRGDVLTALGMTQAEFAKRLGVSRLTVSEILLEKRALSADMAVRIAKLTNTAPESWLRMQEALDLWELARKPERYKHIEPVAA